MERVLTVALILAVVSGGAWLLVAAKDDAETTATEEAALNRARAAASAWAVKFDASSHAIECIPGRTFTESRCTVEKDGRPLALDCTRTGCTLERCAP